ncbi:MAG: oligosaccharide flippase family protein [Bacilli bacterium]|nr:oligosaccharide flippase family protein [Bacilli bacterium]
MRNNKFFISTLILMCSGLITKILGFIIRIIYTRIVGEEAISLYTIVTPTYSLLITFATLALPLAISKLVAENKKRPQKILINSGFIIMLVNIAIILIVFLCGEYIAVNLLKEPRATKLIYAMALTIPFISISSILKGYFFGKQKMFPNALSNIIEQIIRIILIILIIPKLIEKSIIYAVIGLILMSIASETASIITFLCFAPKKFTIKKSDIKPDLGTFNDILSISVPTVSSRLVGNIGFFFEPILLTNILLYSGFSNNYILANYGAYNAYAISLLTLPSFFIMAICSSIVPEISKFYCHNNLTWVRKRFKQATILSFIIGLLFSLLIMAFRDSLLSLLYKTTTGSEFIKVLGPIFVLFYLEGPLTSTMQAIGKAKTSFAITFLGIVVKLSVMSLLSFAGLGIYALIYAEIINIIFVVSLNSIFIKKYLF